ncbi:hypothetical protein F5888DRAFT_1634158 [Russula emetica]|nr:hypothetical protein F5888DRAFT_1634158 [Russula emetica]
MTKTCHAPMHRNNCAEDKDLVILVNVSMSPFISHSNFEQVLADTFRKVTEEEVEGYSSHSYYAKSNLSPPGPEPLRLIVLLLIYGLSQCAGFVGHQKYEETKDEEGGDRVPLGMIGRGRTSCLVTTAKNR